MTTSTIHISRQLLVGELVRRAAHKTPDALAFVYEDEKINYKVREHSVAKVPAILAIGMKEVDDRTVSLRRLDQQGSRSLPLTEAIDALKDEATPPDLR